MVRGGTFPTCRVHKPGRLETCRHSFSPGTSRCIRFFHSLQIRGFLAAGLSGIATPMALLVRIYFNAVFGALGGLLGSLLYSAFFDPNLPRLAAWLLGGGLIGGNIGYFVVSVDAIRDLSLIRFCRLATYGAVLGALGGALGMCVAESINGVLVERLGRPQEWSPLHVLAFMATRGLELVIVGTGRGSERRHCGAVAWQIELWDARRRHRRLRRRIFFWAPLFSRSDAGECRASPERDRHGFRRSGADDPRRLYRGPFGPRTGGIPAGFAARARGWQEGRSYALLKTDTIVGRDDSYPPSRARRPTPRGSRRCQATPKCRWSGCRPARPQARCRATKIFPPQTITIRFNHKKHVKQLKQTCKVCHAAAYTSDSADDRLLPKPAQTCDNCHDVDHSDLDERKGGHGPERAMRLLPYAGFGKDGHAACRWCIPRANMRFPHKKHLARNIQCGQCHGKIDELELATRERAPAHGRLLRLPQHERRGAGRREGHVHQLPPHEARTDASRRRSRPASSCRRAGSTTRVTRPIGSSATRRSPPTTARSAGRATRRKYCTDCHDGKVRPRKVHPNDWLSMHPQAARRTIRAA